MKYVVILGDGMADYPMVELNDRTPLEVANKPFIDGLAKKSEIGLVRTVPAGMKAGSDVANLSCLGYETERIYTGRSPLEAANIGVHLADTDVAARANLVTLSNEEKFEDKTMLDYSAGEISTEEAKILIEYLAKELNSSVYTLYAGISYRHCLVIKNGTVLESLVPPHDISGRPIKQYLPNELVGKEYLELMKRSYELLKNHPINLERIKNGKNPASCIWLWGEGTKPNIQNFFERTGLNAGMISAVDLLNGIARLADMKLIRVNGATGNYDTNFLGKADGAVDALLGGLDYVYVHIEAPDECGHHGDVKTKIYSIEQIDMVTKRIAERLKDVGEEFSILLMPDHPTPIYTKTHAENPVPYLIYRSNEELKTDNVYTEKCALASGILLPSGKILNEKFLNREIK